MYYIVRIEKIYSEADKGTYQYPYVTMWENGQEWLLDKRGNPESPIGNRSADADEEYDYWIGSLLEAEAICEEIPEFIPDEEEEVG